MTWIDIYRARTRMNKIRAIDIPSTYFLKRLFVNFVHFTHFRHKNWKNINYCIKFIDRYNISFLLSLSLSKIFTKYKLSKINIPDYKFSFNFVIQVHPLKITKRRKRKNDLNDRTLVLIFILKKPAATFICRNQSIET